MSDNMARNSASDNNHPANRGDCPDDKGVDNRVCMNCSGVYDCKEEWEKEGE